VDSEDRFRRVARPFGLVAALILVFMMLLTTVAVLSRQLFNAPLLGLVDLSELALVACIFVAMPAAFLRDDNIVVDVVDHLVSPRILHGLRMFGLVLTLAFLGFTAITMIEPAWKMFNRDRYTLVLEIDLYYFWIPILFGFYLASGATVWLLVHRLINGSPPVTPSYQAKDE
jgi:TRAP-type C4-dicarboxylate transport system permease small subunit